MKFYIWSNLRTRLLVFVLLTFLPMAGLILWTARDQRQQASSNAKNEALQLTRSIASHESQQIESSRQLLIALAQLPMIREVQVETCSAVFADLLADYQNYTNIYAVDAAGNTTCSGLPIENPFNSAHLGWFQAVMQTQDFVVGEYQLGQVSGKPLLALAYPIYDHEGVLAGAVGLGLSLEWLNRFVETTALPENSILTVIDSNGTILIRHPAPTNNIGQPYRNEVVLEAIAKQREGTIQAIGTDDRPRLYGFTAFDPPETNATVIIGVDQDIAFADADYIERRNWLGLALGSLLALSIAWIGSEMIARPVNKLVESTRKLAEGDLSTRANINGDIHELNELAATFNTMATSVEKRVIERTAALTLANERTALLQDLTAALSEALTLQQVANVVMEKGMVALGSSISAVSLLAEDGQALQLVTSRNIPKDVYPASQHIAMKMLTPHTDAVKKQTTIWIESPAQYQQQYPEWFNLIYPHTKTEAVVCLPLKIKEAVMGMIVFAFEQPQIFDPETRNFIEALAHYCAQALERARLYTVEHQQRVLTEALHDTAVTVNSSLELSEVLDTILHNIGRVLLHHSANIVLLDNGRARIVRHKGDTQEIKTLEVGKYEPLAAMLSDPRPLVLTGNDPGWKPLFEGQHYHSYAGAPLLSRGKVIGFLNFASMDAGYFTPHHLDRLETFAAQAATAIQNAQLYKQAHEMAVLEERQRLARDLHDAVSQMLFSSSIIAEALPRVAQSNPDKIPQNLERLYRLNRGALAEMRTLLLELRSDNLKDIEITELLHQLSQAVMGNTPLTIALNFEGKHTMPQDVQITFYRIAQEALNNVVKHARATQLDIHLIATPKQVVMSLNDNGRGFDSQEVGGNSMGLNIMRERATAIGAELQVKSMMGEGTEISVTWLKGQASNGQHSEVS